MDIDLRVRPEGTLPSFEHVKNRLPSVLNLIRFTGWSCILITKGIILPSWIFLFSLSDIPFFL